MVYFVSGHLNATVEEFNKYYIPALNYIFLTERIPTFVLADCEGIDRMAQDYLAERKAKCVVTVYHMHDKPEYLASDLFKTKGGYNSHTERDSAMTRASTMDIAFIRPGKENSGTAENVLRRHIMK